MAKKQDKDLLKTLRASGVRKKVARALAESTGKGKRGKQSPLVTRTIDNLRTAASELDSRVPVRDAAKARRKQHVRASGRRPPAALLPGRAPALAPETELSRTLRVQRGECRTRLGVNAERPARWRAVSSYSGA